MKTTKKSSDHNAQSKSKGHDRSPLVTETNPEGAQYDKKGPNAEPARDKLVDGESTKAKGD
jgi:hypothetical protein